MVLADVNNEIDDIMMITTKAATESDDCYMEAKSAEMTEEHAFDANPSGPAFVSKRLLSYIIQVHLFYLMYHCFIQLKSQLML